MFTLRPSRPKDGPRVLEIWNRAVDATHVFLAAEDRQAIGAEVEGFLPQAPMTLAMDNQDVPAAFMILSGSQMEALFVHPDQAGKGLGRQLVETALAEHPNLITHVNTQNTAAAAFYARLGFLPSGQSQKDGQGRAYPLTHLEYRG